MAWRAQGPKPRCSERSSLAPWLAFAAAAHVALLLFALGARRGARPPAGPDSAARADVTDPIWLELIADSTAPPAPDGDAVNTPNAAESPPSLARGPRGGRPSAETAPVVAPGEPAGNEAAELASASRGAPENPQVAGAVEGVAAAPGGSGSRLSLRELGLDRGSNPFIGSVSELPTERQLLNRRLRQSLRGEIAKQDQARGLGPEGPAVTAVTNIVMASATAPNTSALLRVRTDGTGSVTLVDVLEADRDSDEWQRIARELVRSLAGRKLRVPAGSDGVSFQLRVVSRVQLPSGADPGLAIDVLGIPVKQGDGERSTKISILSPVIKEIEVPDSDGIRVPVVAFSLIGAAGDLSDIGAVARRLVTAYLVAMDTHFLPDGASPPAPPPPAPPAAP